MLDAENHLYRYEYFLRRNLYYFFRRPFSSSRNVANADSLSAIYGYGGVGNKFSTNRPGSMSETNLLKYQPQKDGVNVRPESALGLLQGTMTVSIKDYTTF